MLEAAIVGRQVHTQLIPGFDEGQVGTIDLHYLVEAYGGLATIARDFAEHHRQLAPILRQTPSSSPRSSAFAQQFLRPLGIDRPAASILTAEIERAANEIVNCLRADDAAWKAPLRRALLRRLQRRAKRRTPVDTTIIGSSM